MQITRENAIGGVALAISDSGRLQYNSLNPGELHDLAENRTIWRGESLKWIGPGCCDHDRKPADPEVWREAKEFFTQIHEADEAAEKAMEARLEAKAQKEDAHLYHLVQHGLCPKCGTFCDGDCSWDNTN